jgi:hypothetical protein
MIFEIMVQARNDHSLQKRHFKHYGFIASKVLQELMSPDSSPLSNQLTLCAQLPCVKESGVT